jgi:hypothetical protein
MSCSVRPIGWVGVGRPVTDDRVAYRGRSVIQRGIAVLKQWRAITTRYDEHSRTYRVDPSWPPSS